MRSGLFTLARTISKRHHQTPPDSTFFAYYLENRTKLWEYSLLYEQISSSAALADGRVIFRAQHGLHALNVTNGQQLWTFRPPSGAGVSGVSISNDGHVFTVGADGNVYALNQQDGSIIWQTQVAASIENPNSPAVGGGKVFASDGYKLYALDAGKGSIIWSSSLGEIGSGPTVSGGLVFTASSSGVFYALKESDGSIAWSLRLQVEHSGSISSAAICDGIVFIASEEGVRAVGAKP
ncbi:MAG TPA: PQQ-binding-like beta-propeller repeat protein [Nitrososphaerales archaeon]